MGHLPFKRVKSKQNYRNSYQRWLVLGLGLGLDFFLCSRARALRIMAFRHEFRAHNSPPNFKLAFCESDLAFCES